MNINEKLLESIFNEDLEQVKECLAQGANVNDDNGKSYEPPIILVSINGNLEIAKLLIQHGADVNAKNNKNETALKIAQKLNKKLNNKEIILLKAQELLEKAIYKSKQKTKSKQKSNDFEMGM